MTASPSLLDAALASPSRIAAAERRALASKGMRAAQTRKPHARRHAFVRVRQCAAVREARVQACRTGSAVLRCQARCACAMRRIIRRHADDDAIVIRLFDAIARPVEQKGSGALIANEWTRRIRARRSFARVAGYRGPGSSAANVE
ncbi:hypothetical protein [Burkholderia latens]|uniref:hypothetical protein n=1 Tax=Burkholderia latens TaxID=488446 RepID=UPI0015887FFF|nr:hypothetical protein [Burkholderia latens]